MTEIWFYHLTSQPLERTLPTLLERSRSPPAQRALLPLWTYSEPSFLAHGTSRDGDGQLQPVYLTAGTENPNGASVRFCIEAAEVEPVLTEQPDAYERIILMFDGNDDEQLANARAQWKTLKQQNRTMSYWQQDEEGRWTKKA